MADGALIDTGYIIALANPAERGHAAAQEYWRYFTTRFGKPLYLSSIVVSEFELKQKVPDFVLNSTIMLPFNYSDAIQAAKYDWTRDRPEGQPRDALKDDIKIIAQASLVGAEFIITRDGESLVKYCAALRAKRASAV
jgi:hypothetical protein